MRIIFKFLWYYTIHIILISCSQMMKLMMKCNWLWKAINWLTQFNTYFVWFAAKVWDWMQIDLFEPQCKARCDVSAKDDTQKMYCLIICVQLLMHLLWSMASWMAQFLRNSCTTLSLWMLTKSESCADEPNDDCSPHFLVWCDGGIMLTSWQTTSHYKVLCWWYLSFIPM